MIASKVWSAGHRAEVERQLERVTGSAVFSRSIHLQRILKYLIEERFTGRTDRTSQASIAIDVLGRDASFDPGIDAVVRVEVGRLRTKLQEYYHEEGKHDAIRFELPKGHYALQIVFVQATGQSGSSDNTKQSDPDPGTLSEPFTEAIENKGLKRDRRWLRFAFFGVLAAFLVFAYDQNWYPLDNEVVDVELSEPLHHQIAGEPIRPRSVAVLPFSEFGTPMDATDFLADGLLDELVTQLSKISGLRVISRTSMMHYRNRPLDLSRIRRELNVDVVIEGSLQQAADGVHINVHLIDVRTGTELWAESFDRKLTTANVFDIERLISEQTARALQTNLAVTDTPQGHPPTNSLEAYEAYLQGRRQYEMRTPKSMANAISLFQRAIDYDPKFALAYVAMANASTLSDLYGGVDVSAAAEPLIQKALALDDQLAEAYGALGLLKNGAGDWESARTYYERALQLNPNLAETYRWYSILLTDRLHQREKGLEMIRQAALLDPLSALVRSTYGNHLADLGRLEEAVSQYRKAIELDPGLARVYWSLGILAGTVYQQPVEAARGIFKAQTMKPDLPRFASTVAMTLLLNGDFEAAKTWLDNLRQRGFASDADYVCVVLAGALGDDKRALTCGQDALQQPEFRAQILFVMRNADVRAKHYVQARERYARSYPELAHDPPEVNRDNYKAAIDLALVLQKLGAATQARHLLQQSLLVAGTLPRFTMLGTGFEISDAEIYALQGKKTLALTALRQAIDAGWYLYWWRVPQKNPNLESLRDDPSFDGMLQEVRDKLARTREEIRRLQNSGEISLPVPPVKLEAEVGIEPAYTELQSAA